ncbi:MAG TPA: hypothetical protein VGR92_03310 [Steroidobacteraceae bacterium]|nr:hypothetical protein [Steroidobacteraceae bacterium]
MPIRRAQQLGILICICAALLRLPAASAAGEAAGDTAPPLDSFMAFGASIGSRASWPKSSAWGLEFRQTDAPHFAWSVAYLNDGHFPGHHRDGVSGEIWAPFTIDDLMTLSVGGGPFYYFDTEHANIPGGFADVHGWAWVLSADMRLALWSRLDEPGWFLDVRYDWSAPAKDIETHSIGLGFGYRMYSDFASRTPTEGTVPGFAQNELVGYVGKTVVNSFSSQWSFAEAIEYRRELAAEVIRGSLAFVNEGNAKLVRRKGVLYEVWAEPSFWDGNASVGIGWGGYTAVDKSRPTTGRHISYVVSATLSARLPNLLPIWQSTTFGERTDVRVTWHRIVTDYDRDTDILLFGLGYRF